MVSLCRHCRSSGLLTHCRRILFFPYGNHVEHASFYLEHAWEDEVPENWYACVQFALVLWNPNDPTIQISHSESTNIYCRTVSLNIL
jgi:hypothetical protein